MTTSAIRGRRAPMGAAAAVAALALLATPMPASGSDSSRTALLTLTDGSSLSQLADRVAAMGGRVLETLDLADSLLVRIPTGAAVPAGSAEVPDVPMRVNSASTSYEAAPPTYLETIAAPAGAGLGATVALVDTGVASPLLTGVQHLPVDGVGTGDGFGHGTFLAGIIRGTDEFPGVAPGATLIDVKVADDEGATSLSKVLTGLEAVADRGDVDVVNVSLSSVAALPPGFDPLSRALDSLWAMGMTVVVAAGNGGDDGVSSPGNDPVLLTVGALDENGSAARADDSVAEFSARGRGFSRGKPDLVAPGVSIVSTASPGSEAEQDALANAPGTVSGGYMRGSGTSMAAAMVSGAAAAVIAANPAMQPSGVKALLIGTAYDLDSAAGAGAGGLDLGLAVDRAPSAPTKVRPGGANGSAGDWGPAEDDAEAWAAFADAWESGSFKEVRAAWDELSWQTQQWASRMWMLAVLSDSLGLPSKTFQARSWAARSWAFDEWLARSWAARSWAARSWAFDEWVARSWAARSWAARSWAARSWAVDDWLARSWAARSWAARSWAARSWAARSWAARSWATEDWAARSWAARSWATSRWDASAWSMQG